MLYLSIYDDPYCPSSFIFHEVLISMLQFVSAQIAEVIAK